MLFNTLNFAYFFLVVFGVSWLLAPWRRARLLFLLVSSYVFYAGWTFVGWDKFIDVAALKEHHQLVWRDDPALWSHLFQSVRYLPLLFVATTVDWVLAMALGAVERPRPRKLLLIGTVLVNVGILVFFKYWNWGAESFLWLANDVAGASIPDITFEVEYPLGISFFCFMSLSYVVDVYRGVIPPCRSYLEYLTYISFFPHLLAGPIIRGRDLLPHLKRNTRLTAETGGEALFLIASGLVKKVAIGDYLGEHFVNAVFDAPTSYSAVEVLVAMVGFTVQVYCDFSGYSDMAIGLALLLGYRFKLNFDAPFKSVNVVEFWRRWHISLSTWLRDYVFFSLGGAKGKPWRKYRNMFITMVVCGVWHRATWPMLLFGCVQGAVLSATAWVQEKRQQGGVLRGAVVVTAVMLGLTWVLNRWTGRPGIAVLLVLIVAGGWVMGLLVWLVARVSKGRRGGLLPAAVKVLCVAATFGFTTLSFTMFRADTLHLCWTMYERLLTLTTYTPNLHRDVLLVILAALALQWTPRSVYDSVRNAFVKAPAPLQAIALFAVLVGVRHVSSTEPAPFVYFQF